MKIGIVGGGKVGGALARLASAAGHEVRVGRREHAQDGDAVAVGSMAEACTHGDLVVLAIPFLVCDDILPALAPNLAGRIVIDATNPLQADWSPLWLGEANSAAQHIAALLPGARVVKAFNTVFADVMHPDGLARSGEARVTAFVASDDEEAAASVEAFAASLGFAPIRVGALAQARHLESLAHLNIAIAVGCGGGTDAAFVYDQRRA